MLGLWFRSCQSYLPVGFRRIFKLLLLIWVSAPSPGVLAVKRPAPPPPSPPKINMTLQGKLLYRTNGNWTLMVTLSNTYMLPSQPVIAAASGSARAVPTGSWISLVCLLQSSNSRSCSSISGVKIDKVAAPAPTTNVTLKVMVMVLSLTASTECGSRGGANVSEVQNAFVGPSGYLD
ncbi:hypothetical protein VaNZ11_016310, partial [Volvox africanus]